MCALQEKLSGLKALPVLVLASGADEYVPSAPTYLAAMERLAGAMGGARLETIDGAQHALGGHEEQAVGLVVDFLAGLHI